MPRGARGDRAVGHLCTGRESRLRPPGGLRLATPFLTGARNRPGGASGGACGGAEAWSRNRYASSRDARPQLRRALEMLRAWRHPGDLQARPGRPVDEGTARPAGRPAAGLLPAPAFRRSRWMHDPAVRRVPPASRRDPKQGTLIGQGGQARRLPDRQQAYGSPAPATMRDRYSDGSNTRLRHYRIRRERRRRRACLRPLTTHSPSPLPLSGLLGLPPYYRRPGETVGWARRRRRIAEPGWRVARYPRPLSTRLMALSTPRSAASMTGRTGRCVPTPVARPVQ